jgi:hypothetical protein
MSGGSSSPSKTTTTSEPWKEQKPYLLDVFKQAQNQYNAPGPEYFPYSTVAGTSPATEWAQQYITGTGRDQLQQSANSALGALNFNLNSTQDIQNNPYLASAIEAAQRPLVQQFSDAGGVLSGIRDQFQGAGQFGSTRQGIGEGIAAGRLQQQLGDISATMGNEAYMRGLDASVKSLAFLPQIQEGLIAPAKAVDAVGQQQQQMEQAYLNDLINRFNYYQNLPAAQLAQYQNLVQGSYGGTTTQQLPTSGGTSPLSGALGGAATGAAIGGPWGALAGGILGGASSFF